MFKKLSTTCESLAKERVKIKKIIDQQIKASKFDIIDNIDIDKFIEIDDPMKKFMIGRVVNFEDISIAVISHFFGPHNDIFLDSKYFSRKFMDQDHELNLAKVSDQDTKSKFKMENYSETHPDMLEGYWMRREVKGDVPSSGQNTKLIFQGNKIVQYGSKRKASPEDKFNATEENPNGDTKFKAVNQLCPIHEYNLDTHTWSHHKDMTVNPPEALFGSAIHKWGEKIVVFGGGKELDGGEDSSMKAKYCSNEVFILENNVWTSTTPRAFEMIRGKMSFGSDLMGDYMYTFGGFDFKSEM